MPTYEYRCNACSREFEYQQRMSDPELTTCEGCGEDRLERLISRTAFQLKGSGWYKDLYASSKPEKPAANDTSSTASEKPAASSESTSTPASTSSSSGSGSTGSSEGGGGSSTKSAAAPAS